MPDPSTDAHELVVEVDRMERIRARPDGPWLVKVMLERNFDKDASNGITNDRAAFVQIFLPLDEAAMLFPADARFKLVLERQDVSVPGIVGHDPRGF